MLSITLSQTRDKTAELTGEVFITKNYHPMTRGDYVSRGARYWESYTKMWGIYDYYGHYYPGAVGHDHSVNIFRTYSQIGQEEGNIAFRLLGAGFGGSGWESQSIYSLYNTTAISTTYILAYAQNNSIPIYSINQSNLNESLANLTIPDWIKDDTLSKL